MSNPPIELMNTRPLIEGLNTYKIRYDTLVAKFSIFAQLVNAFIEKGEYINGASVAVSRDKKSVTIQFTDRFLEFCFRGQTTETSSLMGAINVIINETISDVILFNGQGDIEVYVDGEQLNITTNAATHLTTYYLTKLVNS